MTETALPAIETVSNPCSERDYLVHLEEPEFTCLCPLTAQPDFATLILDYVPDQLLFELKSIKLYFHSFRQRGIFHEGLTNLMVDELAAVCQPRLLRLESRWWPRGGIHATVLAEYVRPGFVPPERLRLPARLNGAPV